MRWLIVGLLIGFFLRGQLSGKSEDEEYIEEKVTQPQRSRFAPFILGTAFGIALMVVLPIILFEVVYVEDTEPSDLSGLIRVGCEPEHACAKMRPRQEMRDTVTLEIPEAVTLDLRQTRLPSYAQLQVCINLEECRDIHESMVLRDLKGTVTFRVIRREHTPVI